MRDGNIIFALWDGLVEDVASSRPRGLRPSTVRDYLHGQRGRLIRKLEPLRRIYVLPRPGEPTNTRERTEANIAALQMLDRGESSARTRARVLGQYTGWGGLSLEQNQRRIPEQFDLDPIALAHEYYTPIKLADAVADVLCPLLPELADVTGRIKALEPSAGTGRLIDALNRRCTELSIVWTAAELSDVAARILESLHPATEVFRGPYERFNQQRPQTIGTWNLVVSNPPFGSSARVRVYAKEDNDRAYDEPFDFAYFMRRGLDSLAYGGVGAFLIPRGFLTSITHRDLRERILLRPHLLGA